MQAEVDTDGVGGHVRAGVLGPQIPAGSADDDGDLALMVQPLAARWAYDRAPVTVQRRDRLVEVGRRGRRLRAEIGDPAAGVQVDAYLSRIEADGRDSVAAIVAMRGTDVELGPAFTGTAGLELLDSPVEELTRLAPREMIGGYYRGAGTTFAGGETLA
jgi:acetoacetate decarboxylase